MDYLFHGDVKDRGGLRRHFPVRMKRLFADRRRDDGMMEVGRKLIPL